MPKIEEWSAPRCDAIQAAYRIVSGQLRSCNAHTGDAFRDRARKTYSLWKAAKSFPDASMLVVKSGSATSLGIRNGGIIVEGEATLNVGLFRAATRSLQPVTEPVTQDTSIKFSGRFQHVFWEIMNRLQGSVMPRAYAFEFGSVAGAIHADSGQFRFSGDFLTPSAFVAELRAACQVEDEGSFTLIQYDPKPDVQDYSFDDVLAEVSEAADDGQFTFSHEGWPLALATGHAPEAVQGLAAMAACAGRIRGNEEDISVFLLGDDSRPIVSLKVESDATFGARIH